MRKLRKAKALASLATLLLVATALVPMISVPALAQATTGTIRGVVNDQAGAVVSGATVTAKNQATGVSSPAFKSTGDGIYVVPNLIPGKYTLTVEMANFKRSVFTDIEVRVGQDTSIDATLQPGGVTETVTVTAGSEENIQKETSQISASFDARKVAELPSNNAGAGIDTLALLAPGVLPGFGNVNSNGTTLSVNGQRARSNNFTIDGQDNNDLSIGGPNYFVSNQDLVQDFQVITNNFSAQYGRNQGAIINIVTKAGTNDFHGSAFEFHTNRKLFGTQNNIERRSQNPDDPTTLEAPPMLYNVFGGTVGGPIIKDKAFFFGSFQGIRDAETVIARSGSVAILPSEFGRLQAAFPGNPIAEMITKYSAFKITDFGNVRFRTDLGNDVQTVTIGGRNFLVGGPFDIVTIRLAGQAITGDNTFQAAFPERAFSTALTAPADRQNEYTGRGDVKLTDKDSIWARYLFQDGVVLDTLGGSNGFTGNLPFRSQNVGGNWTRQVSSRAINEFGFGYSRLFLLFGGGCEGKIGCIPSPLKIDEAFANVTFNVRSTSTASTLQTIGPATNLPQGRTVEAFQWHDNFSITRGKHQIVTGVDIRRLRNVVPFLPNVNGQFTIGTATNFINNSPQSVTVAAGQSILNYTETDQFYFFQDDFKVRDNLTLNLGGRYEYVGQPINLLHDLGVVRESNAATALWKLTLPLEARVLPKIPADKNNFAPRFGFAWTPRFFKKLLGEDATVIRGGYSIAYDPAFYNILLNASTASPVVFNNITLNPASPTGTNPTLFRVPTPDLFGPAVRAFALANGVIKTGIQDPRFQNAVPVASNFHLPYAQQWSLGIQRQINRNNVVEVRYVGTHAVGLFQTINRNPRIDRLVNGFTFGGLKFPGFPDLVPIGVAPLNVGSGGCADDAATPSVNEGNNCRGRIRPNALIQARENTATSTYNGLQMRYNGRLFNQLTLGATYSLSKALDNSSEVFAFNVNSALTQSPFNTNAAEKGYSGFDRRNAWSFNAIWDLPWMKDQKGILGHIAGGWQLNGTQIITSGRRWTPGEAFNGTYAGFSSTTFALPGGASPGASYADPSLAASLRPFYGNPNADARLVGIYQADAFMLDQIFFGGFLGVPQATSIAGQKLYSLNELLNGGNTIVEVSSQDVRYIVNGAGAAALKGTPWGDVPRSSEKGPRLNQMNIGIFKNTRINERITIQFRTEIFNALNHPNPGYGLLGNEAGDSPSILLENAGAIGGAFAENQDIQFSRRLIQFGLRVIF